MHTRTLLLLLLFGGAMLHAGTTVDPPGALLFSLEIHPGKRDWIQCHLNAKGFFMVSTDGKNTTGSLSAQESLRIMEEFEKICVAAGADRFPPRPAWAGRPVGPYFHFTSPQGQIFYLEGRESPPPTALTAFMITLSQKLLDHASKQNSPAAPPPQATRPFDIAPALR